MNRFDDKQVCNKDKYYEAIIQPHLEDVTKMAASGKSLDAISRHFGVSRFRLSEEMMLHKELAQAMYNGLDKAEDFIDSKMIEAAKGAKVTEEIRDRDGNVKEVKTKTLAPNVDAALKIQDRIAHNKGRLAMCFAEYEERKKINPAYMEEIESRTK